MEIVILLIGLALALVAVITWAFFWAVKSGQFDDMEGPAQRILMDDEAPVDANYKRGKKNDPA